MADSVQGFQDVAAERAVLGAVLIGQHGARQRAGGHHRRRLLATRPTGRSSPRCMALDGRSERVDPLTLAEQLKIRGQLATVGGPGVPGRSSTRPCPSRRTRSSTRTSSRTRRLRRALAVVGREILELASARRPATSPSCSTRPSARSSSSPRSGAQAISRPMSELMERGAHPPRQDEAERRRASPGLATGFVDLDNQLTGLHGGELIVLAARPGIGKTSLAMNIALHVALQREARRRRSSASKCPRSSWSCACCHPARVDMKKLRGGRLSPNDEERISEAANELFKLRVLHRRLRRRCRRSTCAPRRGGSSSKRARSGAHRHRLPAADAPEGQGREPPARGLGNQPRAQAARQGARRADHRALSQLNRKVEERKGGKPMLSDLRESGAIEQDADVVMFIHREEEDEEGGAPAEARAVDPRRAHRRQAAQRPHRLASISSSCLSSPASRVAREIGMADG